MSIPQIIEIEDMKIGRTIQLRFISKTKNDVLVYENVKTKCKQCFNLRDFANINVKKIKIRKDEHKERLKV